jgi:flagellar FliL protein
MKRLVILLVLILVLAGAGAGGWWFFLRDDGGVAEVEREPEPGMDFVKVDPLSLPVIREGRVVRHVTVILTLEVPEGGANRVVFKSMRQLQDAYIHELHSLYSRRFAWEHNRLIHFVKRRILAASEKVLGPDIVHEVVVQGIETGAERPG